MLRELITRPIGMVAALLDLPKTLERSVREANALMEISREQLELMRRQADEALAQAERMNDLLARVVKLTEPLERAQRGGEYVGGRLKEMIFGEENPEQGGEVSGAGARGEELTRQAERAEDAAAQAESAADDAETAAEDAEVATDHAEVATDEAEDAAESATDETGGTTIRVIPNRPDPEGDEPEQ